MSVKCTYYRRAIQGLGLSKNKCEGRCATRNTRHSAAERCGTESTHSRGGTNSIIDLSFVSFGLATGSSWEVCDTFTDSDHATSNNLLNKGEKRPIARS